VIYGTNNDSGLIIDAGYPGKALRLEFTVEDDGVFTAAPRAQGPSSSARKIFANTITRRTPKSRALTNRISDRSIAAPPSGLSSCPNDEA
jgi:hypothetical protein